MKPGLLAHSCCTTPAAMCLWAATFVLIYGASLIARSTWPTIQPLGDPAILVALAAACLINFGRNRTLDLGIKGPLFVLGAASAALIEGGVWQVDMTILWGVVLVVVGLAFIVEWRRVGPDSTARCVNPLLHIWSTCP